MAGPNPFVSPDVVRQRVAECLHVPVGELPEEFAGLCATGARDATSELRRVLVLKGYSVAQVYSWDDREYYAGRLAAYFALIRSSALSNYDLKAVELLDCRKELTEAAAIIIGDVAVAPPVGGEVGGISSGTLDAVDEVKGEFGGWFA